MLAFLELRPSLNAEYSHRRSLLMALCPSCPRTSRRCETVLRYLLHGNMQDSALEMELFVDGDTAWSAAARWALAASDQLWRMISPELTDLKPSEADRLRLRTCDPTSVPALFKNAKLEALDPQVFATRSDWRNQLLQEWPDGNKEILKQLPLFMRSDEA